jgi:integrase/recombinase XerC
MNELASLRNIVPSLAVVPDIMSAWLAGRRATTVRSYAADIAAFARFTGQRDPAAALRLFWQLDAAGAHYCALAWRAQMIDRGLSSASVARRLASLRSVSKLARQLGLCDFRLEVESPRVQAYRAVRGPAGGEAGFRAMLGAAAAIGGAKGARDTALLRLMHDLGLRRAEVVGLDVEDLDLAEGSVAILG